MGESGGGRSCGVFGALGAALDAGGGEPSVELGGLAAVEVLHHGVEGGDFLAAFEEEDADALGAFEALEVGGAMVVRFLPSMASPSALRSWTKSAGRSAWFSLPKVLTRSRLSWRRMSWGEVGLVVVWRLIAIVGRDEGRGETL